MRHSAFRLNEPEHNESFQFERVSHFVCIQFYVHQNIHKSIPFHRERIRKNNNCFSIQLELSTQERVRE